jgi:membrane protein
VSIHNVTHATYPAGTVSARTHSRRFFEILGQIWVQCARDDCISLAAEMAYFFVLALFPFFVVLGALAGFLLYTNLWSNLSNAIVRHFPSGARDIALQTILNLAHKNKTFLSLGFIATLWASSSGVVSLMENLSRVYNVPETRGFWKKRLIAIGVLIVTSAFFLASFGMLALGHRIGRFLASELYLGPGFQIVWEIFRWCFLLALLQEAVAIIDTLLTNKQPTWR